MCIDDNRSNENNNKLIESAKKIHGSKKDIKRKKLKDEERVYKKRKNSKMYKINEPVPINKKRPYKVIADNGHNRYDLVKCGDSADKMKPIVI